MAGQYANTNGAEDMINVENTVNTVTNTVVQVDYIDGEYHDNDQDGFKKKKAGYNGSSALPRTITKKSDGS